MTFPRLCFLRYGFQYSLVPLNLRGSLFSNLTPKQRILDTWKMSEMLFKYQKFGSEYSFNPITTYGFENSKQNSSILHLDLYGLSENANTLIKSQSLATEKIKIFLNHKMEKKDILPPLEFDEIVMKNEGYEARIQKEDLKSWFE